MHDFHHSYIKRKYNAKLLLADTGSLVYEIKTGDVYEDSHKDKHLLDLSNYPKDSKFFDPSNEKFIDKMKDESKGKINDEFVGLKSMIHSIKNVDGGENKRRKGINQSVLKNINMKNIVMFCLIKNGET